MDWSTLNNLGKEYRSYVDQGIGTTVDERSPRQIEIANEIVTAVQPMLYKIAGLMKHDAAKVRAHGRTLRLSAANSSATVDDLVQEGSLFLIERLGNNTGTYAMSTFVHTNAVFGMYRAINNHWRGPIAIPEELQDVVRANNALGVGANEASCFGLSQSLQVRNDSGKHLVLDANSMAAVYLGMTNHYVNLCDAINTVQNNSEPGLDEFLDSGVRTENQLQKQQLADAIDQILTTMPDRKKTVLSLRFGLGTDVDHTLEEIGEYLGCTREWVRVVEAKALKMLRHPTRAKLLREYV